MKEKGIYHRERRGHRAERILARAEKADSSASGCAALGGVEPKIDGFFHAGRRLVRKRNLAALTGGGVARVQHVQHHEAVFSGGLRSLFAARATREMRQLLRRAVIPEFFEDGIGPAFRGGG